VTDKKDLTRDDIVAADDVGQERVEIPEWGGGAWLRVMNDDERTGWEAWLLGRREMEPADRIAGVRRELVARTLVDGHGKRLFERADELRVKSGRVINRLFETAQQLNGLQEDAVAQEKKDSSAIPPSSSGTG
jgi:hypothetical protein